MPQEKMGVPIPEKTHKEEINDALAEHRGNNVDTKKRYVDNSTPWSEQLFSFLPNKLQDKIRDAKIPDRVLGFVIEEKCMNKIVKEEFDDPAGNHQGAENYHKEHQMFQDRRFYNLDGEWSGSPVDDYETSMEKRGTAESERLKQANLCKEILKDWDPDVNILKRVRDREKI